MLPKWKRKRFTPIGCDISDGSVKLVQFHTDLSQVVDASRWDLNLTENENGETPSQQLAEGIARAREGRVFRGRDVVVCLGSEQLFLQNLRVPKAEGRELDRVVQQEAASRIPYPVEETEIRYLEASDIRQGDTTLREVIVLACHRPVLESLLSVFLEAGLRPLAVDVAPAAVVRSYLHQFRRDDERNRRAMIVHVGYENSVVVIAQGDDVLFVKYLDIGGRHLNESVARHLGLSDADSHSLRRRLTATEIEDDIEKSIFEAMRSELERLTRELSMCVRYHSVTFRGRPLEHLLLAGSEANGLILNIIRKRLDMNCELSDPFRRFPALERDPSRHCQWDIATGLALRSVTT